MARFPSCMRLISNKTQTLASNQVCEGVDYFYISQIQQKPRHQVFIEAVAVGTNKPFKSCCKWETWMCGGKKNVSAVRFRIQQDIFIYFHLLHAKCNKPVRNDEQAIISVYKCVEYIYLYLYIYQHSKNLFALGSWRLYFRINFVNLDLIL